VIEVRDAPAWHYDWIAERANLTIGPQFRAIEALHKGTIVGMVGYDGWTKNSCCMHVAIDNPIAVRRLVKPAFEKPFVQLGLGLVLGSVLSTNQKALEFDLNLGFKLRLTIRDGWEKGVDMYILEMRRENCRWIK
jgi:RimJ/RimL family protein N-acetyltransferase